MITSPHSKERDVPKSIGKPVIARPWSQMYDSRKRGKRSESPNHPHLLAQGYDDLAKMCKNIYENIIKKKQELDQKSDQENSRASHHIGGSYLHSNYMSEFDLEESKEESNLHDNDSFIMPETTKRKIDILSSNSSRLESPTSFYDGVGVPAQYMKKSIGSTTFGASQAPSLHNFRAIRNYSKRDSDSRKEPRYFSCSPINEGENGESSFKVKDNNIVLKINDEYRVEVPNDRNEISEFINKYFSNTMSKRPSRPRKKIKKSKVTNIYLANRKRVDAQPVFELSKLLHFDSTQLLFGA